MSKLAAIRDTIAVDAFDVRLEDDRLAYVKEVRSEDVAALYPEAPQLAPGQRVFALHLGDGTPIVLADSREGAVADAVKHRLETVTLH